MPSKKSEPPLEQMETEQQRRTRHSLEGSSVDWNLCLFCQKSKYKGNRQLYNLCTPVAELSLREAAEALNDDAIKTKIAFPDLIAQEAKHHKKCHQLYMANARRFMRKHSKALKTTLKRNYYNIEMKQLLENFQELLIKEGLTPDDAVNYRAEKLKDRLVLHYDFSLTFHRQQAFNRSELAFRKKIEIKDVINRAMELNEMREAEKVADITFNEQDNVPKILFYAALIFAIRNEISART